MARPSYWSKATFFVIASATAGTATATQPAKANGRNFCTSITLSARGGAVAAAVTFQLLDGATPIDQIEIPAATLAPIFRNYTHPCQGSINTLMSATVPSLGAGVTGTVVLQGFTLNE